MACPASREGLAGPRGTAIAAAATPGTGTSSPVAGAVNVGRLAPVCQMPQIMTEKSWMVSRQAGAPLPQQAGRRASAYAGA